MSDKPIVYADATGIVYRASALGGCQKALLVARLEYDPAPTDERMQKVFDAGHSAEIEAKEKIALLEHGPVYFAQTEVVFRVNETVSVVGHVDGLHCKRPTLLKEAVEFEDAVAIAEIKSQSADAWAARKQGKRGPLFERYDWQIAVYSHALQLPVVLWWFNRDTGEIEPELVRRPHRTANAIRDRVLEVERLAETGVLGLSCDVSMYPCPYFYLHDEADATRREVDWGEVEPEAVDETVIDMLAASYKRNAREEKVARERKDRAKEALRVQFRGKTIATEAGWRVTFYEGRRTVECRAVIEDDPFRQEQTWENIRVTEPKK